MIDISVVIVSYNVKYFLYQTIESVLRSANDLKIEIIVVDNNSSDESIEYLKLQKTNVILVENKVNIGFSKANNQGIKIAKGKYILILNPDTILQENTLYKCFNELELDPKKGALGVKMIDGTGVFLPESKRGLPTLWVSIYYFLGLTKLFPKSKKINQYHLGFLSENESHEIDILSGAFMFCRSDILHQIGGFDEMYFMYGEDIDLSYQIKKHGYLIYYLSKTTILHYKGESTRKESKQYIHNFLSSMLLFYNKNIDKKSKIQNYFFSKIIQIISKKNKKNIDHIIEKKENIDEKTLIIGEINNLELKKKILLDKKYIIEDSIIVTDLEKLLRYCQSEEIKSLILNSSKLTFEYIIYIIEKSNNYKIKCRILDENNGVIISSYFKNKQGTVELI